MASPLTMYVPIKQDPDSQGKAEFAVQNFAAGVKAGLDATGIVHYATLALVPNPVSNVAAEQATDDKPKHLAILLMTDFDLDMEPYLKTFWDQPGFGIKTAIQGVAAIAANKVPPINTLEDFVSFINSVNLTPAPTGEPPVWTNFYQAYPQTVQMILNG